MKRFPFSALFICLIALFTSRTAQAQWLISSTNILNTNTGKVGIGLGNSGVPAYKLHVVGDRIRLGNTTLSTAKTIDMRVDGAQVDIMANNAHLFIGSATGNTIIQGFGRKVGIGLGAPEAELHVNGTENNGTAGTFKITSGTNTMVFDGNEIDVIGASLNLQNNSSGNLHMVNGGGSVRIGSLVAPTAKLDVSGDVRCFNLFTNSDRRYKTQIRTLEGALDKILAMRGTSYDFEKSQVPEGYTAGKQTGFIAQEIKEVMPELVKEDVEGMLSVNYIGVIPVLVEALKEQHEVIVEKETRIAALEMETNELKARLAKIEAALGVTSERDVKIEETRIGVTVSPNPSAGLVTISLNNAAAKQVVVNILDAAGRTIATRTTSGADEALQFDLRNYPAGMYVVQVLADGKLQSSNKIQFVK
jgi:hypothetical protein